MTLAMVARWMGLDLNVDHGRWILPNGDAR
jgi:hypothetical protein